jgi:hypothetical protein
MTFVDILAHLCILRRRAAGNRPLEIENRLHYPKDVVFAEDSAPLCDGYAPANFAIIRTIALNLFRLHGFASITKGIRHLAHDISHLLSFFQ